MEGEEGRGGGRGKKKGEKRKGIRDPRRERNPKEGEEGSVQGGGRRTLS